MSQDQRPGKVKLYSGSGAPQGVRAVSGGGVPQRRGADGKPVSAPVSAAAAAAGAEAGEGGGQGWLLVALFILGSAAGAALFMTFGPL